jgi:hypothetical protein
MVWDYSLENIKVLNFHGVNKTLHVPLGYAPSMETSVAHSTIRDIDVIFVGEMSARRKLKLRDLGEPTSACRAQFHTNSEGLMLRTIISDNCWGNTRLLVLG